ncbi:ABC transporter substrate-binding protein [Paenibacillus sp. YPG26]|uniref:ABC transporter substrate-binding protein n=1 Tax=Paenibacillus sp. YPG26 TaxID=2878915 RepID=UPI00203E1635|nr:ABC transporter substrate-binding protein [Paenibacillus sp. YPG26]USB34122.1 ABC transporter substrate-binding protein [Paenibacillus sp. YPG26]
MRKSKSILASLLVLSFILLSACGNKGEADSASKATADVPKSSAPVEIEFWYGLGGKLGDNMKRLIDKFNSSQKEVVVKPVVQGNYDETKKKLQAAMASGKVPAAVLSADISWAKKGLFAPLDDLIAKEDSFDTEDFIPTFLEQGKTDNKQYFVPMYGTTQLLYYNKSMFEKAGVTTEDIKTWEGLAEAAKKMTVKNGDNVKVYGWEPMWGYENLLDAVLSKGGKVLSDDGKTVLIDSPEWIQTWDSFRKWIHEDKIMSIHSGGQGWEYWYKTIDDVMQDRAAGYTGSSGDQGDLDFNKLAAAPQPGWNGHEPAPVASAILAGIPAAASPEQQAAAMKWFAFFTSAQTTADWSMNTGYIAVRKSAMEEPAFKAFAEKNPQSKQPLLQAQTASAPFIDPTGGKITDALKIAADKLEIQNLPADQVLKEAKETAQRELDRVQGK